MMLPVCLQVRVLGLLEPTSASVSDAFTWPQSVKRLAIVRFHASTLALMPEISQACGREGRRTQLHEGQKQSPCQKPAVIV
jgi:hypothetical protein